MSTLEIKINDTHTDYYANNFSVGFSLAQLLRSVDVVESHIGDIGIKVNSDDRGLVVSGLTVNRNREFCDLLSDTSISIDRTSKFYKAFGKTALELLRDYISASKCLDGADLISKLKGIEKNKYLVEPIKPGTDVIIQHDNKALRTRIDTNKWFSCRETNRLECILISDKIPELANRRVKVGIEEYGKKITNVDVEREFSTLNRGIINMTKFGIIKPIALQNKNDVIIIDNQYVYKLEDDKAMIIGGWANGKLAGMERDKDRLGSIYKKLEVYIRYIGNHKRYIAPYGLMDCNILSVKEL